MIFLYIALEYTYEADTKFPYILAYIYIPMVLSMFHVDIQVIPDNLYMLDLPTLIYIYILRAIHSNLAFDDNRNDKLLLKKKLFTVNKIYKPYYSLSLFRNLCANPFGTYWLFVLNKIAIHNMHDIYPQYAQFQFKRLWLYKYILNNWKLRSEQNNPSHPLLQTHSNGTLHPPCWQPGNEMHLSHLSP